MKRSRAETRRLRKTPLIVFICVSRFRDMKCIWELDFLGGLCGFARVMLLRSINAR